MIHVTFPTDRAGIDYSIEHNQHENLFHFLWLLFLKLVAIMATSTKKKLKS